MLLVSYINYRSLWSTHPCFHSTWTRLLIRAIKSTNVILCKQTTCALVVFAVSQRYFEKQKQEITNNFQWQNKQTINVDKSESVWRKRRERWVSYILQCCCSKSNCSHPRPDGDREFRICRRLTSVFDRVFIKTCKVWSMYLFQGFATIYILMFME